MTNQYFFTIITSTLNASKTLPRLLESLAEQTCRDFNLIIQDGESSDATMAIVEQYNNILPEILAVSCKDNGIYDAWNKALIHWQNKIGKWILFLGADDELAGPNILLEAKNVLLSCSENILYAEGYICLIDYEKKTSQILQHEPDIELRFRKRFYGMPLFHSALFCNSSLIKKNKFDQTLSIAGDYDFILRTWDNPQQLYFLPFLVTNMALYGVSSAQHTYKTCTNERLKVIRKNIKDWKAYICYLLVAADTYAYPLKKLVKKVLLSFSYGKILWEKLHNFHKQVMK